MKNTHGVEESTDWHLGAALKLRAALKENGQLSALRLAVRKRDWIIENHHFFGTDIRNWLRKNGYDEERLGIWNLDDHYIPVLLLAVGYEVKGGYTNQNLDNLHERLVTVTGRTIQD